MVTYPPYIENYGKISEVFKKIQEAQVPAKFTNDFIYTVLGLKSTTYRGFIPLLKKLGFIDEANVPQIPYREYRDPTKSKVIIANQIRVAYKELFAANEYANKLKREEVLSKLNSLLGTPVDDPYTPKAAATFIELSKLGDFENVISEVNPVESYQKPDDVQSEVKIIQSNTMPKLGISYTINLNLPATNDVEVFNAIFKALKEHLLR